MLAAAMALAPGCAATLTDPSAPAPPGTLSVDVAPPAAGTRWVMRATSVNRHTGRTQSTTETLSVIGDGVHAGRPAYHVWDGHHVQVYDRATGSWIATVDSHGDALFGSDPHDGALPPTLWVGRTWVARFASREREAGRTVYDMTFVRRATAYEDIAVPAGTFKAFRIETIESDERAAVRRATYWYAPDVRLIVKRTGDRYVRERDGFVQHDTVEMIEHRPPSDEARRPRVDTRVALAETVTVPIRIVNNVPVVEILLNGTQRVPFIVDTGASFTTISPAVVERLGIVVPADAPRRRFVVVGGQQHEAPVVRLPRLELGAAVVEDLEVGVFLISGTGGIGGLLGGDVLHRFRFGVDRSGGLMTLAPLPREGSR